MVFEIHFLDPGDQGAEKDKQNYEGSTALTYAIDFGHFKIAELLVARGADIQTKDAKGRTPKNHAEASENDAFLSLFD